MSGSVQNLNRHPLFGFMVREAKRKAGGWIEDDAEFEALVRAEYEALKRLDRPAGGPAPDEPEHERDSLDTLVAEWTQRVSRPAAGRATRPDRPVVDTTSTPTMRPEDVPDDGLGAFRDMLRFEEPAPRRGLDRLLADTHRLAQRRAQAQADTLAARLPGKAKTVFERPIPKGTGPKKRWSVI